MQVIEPLMRPGRATLTLRPDAPPEIRNALRDATLNRDGYLVVFDVDTDSPSLAAADHTFWLTKRTGADVFVAVGILALLESDGGLGRHVANTNTYTARSLDAYLDLVLPYGGLTKGTVTNVSDVAAEWTAGLGAREFIDAVCAAMGAVYRVNADGTVDAGTRDVVFNASPDVMVTGDVGPEQTTGDLLGVNGVVGSLLENAEHVTSRAIGYGLVDTSTTTNAGVQARGLGGSEVLIVRPVNLPSSDGTELSSLTSAAAARFADPTRTYSVESDRPGVRDLVAPGDVVYVYDPAADVVGDTLVDFCAEPTYPIEATVNAITWSVTVGQDVKLYRPNESDPWTDLAQWLVFGDSRSQWQVTSGWSIADIALVNGPSRLVPEPPSLVAGGVS